MSHLADPAAVDYTARNCMCGNVCLVSQLDVHIGHWLTVSGWGMVSGQFGVARRFAPLRDADLYPVLFVGEPSTDSFTARRRWQAGMDANRSRPASCLRRRTETGALCR